MQKLNNKGIAHIGLIIGVIVVLLIIVIGWFVWDRNQDDDQPQEEAVVSQEEQNEQQDQEQQELVDVPQSWLPYEINLVRMNLSAPDDWTDISDPTLFEGPEFEYEEVVLRAPDGFELKISANNLPRGFGGIEETPALEATAINSPTDDQVKYFIVADTDGKIRRIYVGNTDVSAGDKVFPASRVATDYMDDAGGMIAIEINGEFDDRVFDSLDSFNAEESVEIAKQILKTITFVKNN